MNDVLFVQFYWIGEGTYGRPLTIGELSNGFSFVWNECKEMGEFLWVEGVPDFTDYAAMAMNPLPIEKGKVYVSAWYASHLTQAFIWATMYPKIEFVVGGHNRANMPMYPALPNLRITEDLAEREIFGMKEASKNWNLEIPDGLLPQNVDAVMFSYTIERKCYWGKCNFCDEYFTGTGMEWFVNDASSLYVPDTRIPSKIIFLYEPSLSPKFLRQHYKDLPVRDDVYFQMFCRGDHAMAQAIREIFGKGEGPKPTNTYWSLGVEFPSNRMLEWMGKGATVESLLETIKVLCEHNSNMVMLFISNWDNLVESDVEEAIRFFNDAKEHEQRYSNDVRFVWNNLVLGPGTRLTEEYLQMEDKQERMRSDAFGGISYMLALDEKQRGLNERVVIACRETFPGKEIVMDTTMEKKVFPPDSGDEEV